MRGDSTDGLSFYDVDISIHSPRMRGDFFSKVQTPDTLKFQSTPLA